MICKRCVMDDATPGIEFDSDGVCNYCHQQDSFEKMFPVGGFTEISKKMPKRCVVGLSGGLDSSYLLYLAKEVYGLDPIAITVDNGWSTPIADKNVKTMTDALDVPHHVGYIDRDLSDDTMLAFMKAGLPDVEAVTDISFIAELYKAAAKFKCKDILIGSSFRTEGITPHGMFYFDAKYVSDVHRHYGQVSGDTDMLWLRNQLKWMIIGGIRRHTPLYYLDYVRADAMDFLKDNFGWEWYGGHHRENVFTEFNNNYWLYYKFGVDFRKVEYSALIRSRQMDRDDALCELETPPAVDSHTLDVVRSRLGITRGELDTYLKSPNGTRASFKTYKPTFKRLAPLFWVAAKMNRVPWSFYEKYCHD